MTKILPIYNKKFENLEDAMWALHDAIHKAIKNDLLKWCEKYHYVIVHRPKRRKYKYVIFRYNSKINGYRVTGTGLYDTWDLSDFDEVIKS